MRGFKITHRLTNTTENLSRYFNEISKYEMLTPEKESELAFKAKAGDEKAKEKILKGNLRFVVSVAKSYEMPGANLEDLISEGNRGLIEAIENFDPSTGFKLISYAIWHIRKNIFKYLSDSTRSIRIPINVSNEIRKYNLIEENFISYHGREPSMDEMTSIIRDFGNGMEISDNTLEAIKFNPRSVPLEIQSNDPEESFSPINYVESSEKTDSLAESNDNMKIINSILSELKPIERKIVEMRYGLDRISEPLSFTKIAERFDRSPEWARRVCKIAEKKIKVIIRRKQIKELLF